MFKIVHLLSKLMMTYMKNSPLTSIARNFRYGSLHRRSNLRRGSCCCLWARTFSSPNLQKLKIEAPVHRVPILPFSECYCGGQCSICRTNRKSLESSKMLLHHRIFKTETRRTARALRIKDFIPIKGFIQIKDCLSRRGRHRCLQ